MARHLQRCAATRHLGAAIGDLRPARHERSFHLRRLGSWAGLHPVPLARLVAVELREAAEAPLARRAMHRHAKITARDDIIVGALPVPKTHAGRERVGDGEGVPTGG